MEFSIECIKNGIKPILGSNIFVRSENFAPGFLLLLSKNKKGFQNLSKLISISSLKNSANSAYLDLRNLVTNKLDKVEELINLKLESKVDLIQKMTKHHLILLNL